MDKLSFDSNLENTCPKADKKTANSAKLVGGSWCTQQDSNLWPFDS